MLDTVSNHMATTLTNSNGPQLKLIARTSQSNIEFKGGTLRIRRESGSGSLNTHLQFPDTQNGNAFFFNSVTADAFQTSDNRLKDNQEKITADEAFGILQAVTPKKYTRNDKDNEPRHGFIAQEWLSALRLQQIKVDQCTVEYESWSTAPNG